MAGSGQSQSLDQVCGAMKAGMVEYRPAHTHSLSEREGDRVPSKVSLIRIQKSKALAVRLGLKDVKN